MHSKGFKLLKETGNLQIFLALCKSPVTTNVTWQSPTYFYWNESPQGYAHWDSLMGKINTCYPTEDDVLYCKQHYPELYI